MGECNYYLKARFATDAAARAAVPRLVALLAEGDRAYNFWQDTRGRGFPRSGEYGPQVAQQFWAEFRAQFPLVCEYLGELNGIEDWNNGLSGQLGVLKDPAPKRHWLPSAELSCRDAVLFLQLNRIWHCSNMRLLERFCVDDLGALAVGSISEEEIEPNRDGPDVDPFTVIRV
jgi:hypothetical protein